MLWKPNPSVSRPLLPGASRWRLVWALSIPLAASSIHRRISSRVLSPQLRSSLRSSNTLVSNAVARDRMPWRARALTARGDRPANSPAPCSLFHHAAVSREHERDSLGTHRKLLGDLTERVAKAAQRGDVADPLRQLIEDCRGTWAGCGGRKAGIPATGLIHSRVRIRRGIADFPFSHGCVREELDPSNAAK